jgi:hypothetical protein
VCDINLEMRCTQCGAISISDSFSITNIITACSFQLIF